MYFLLAEKTEASSATTIKTFNRNFILQDSSTNRTKERKSTTKDLIVSHIYLNANYCHCWWHLHSVALLSVGPQSEPQEASFLHSLMVCWLGGGGPYIANLLGMWIHPVNYISSSLYEPDLI